MKKLKNRILSKSNQYNFYKTNYFKLKKENIILKDKIDVFNKFSLSKRFNRGTSHDYNKPIVLEYIVTNISKDAKILDVGFGAGIYGKLLKTLYYYNIDGIDTWNDNIEEMFLDKIYDNIFIEDILEFDFDFYDLIIMGDVLEHIELEKSKTLLKSFIDGNKCSTIIVQVPFESPNETKWGGNPHEVHLQPDINEKYMKKHFPYLKLLKTVKIPQEKLNAERNEDAYSATYIWNKN